MPITVHIVTVLFNSGDVLDTFVASLRAQSWPDWKLIAVDNGSSDGAPERLAAIADPRIELLRNRRNLGFARATNRGLRQGLSAGGKFFFLMNNDVAFEPDFLAGLMRDRAALGAEVIAPRIMYMKTPDKAWYAGGHFNDHWVFKSVHEETVPQGSEPSRMVDFASGCCLGLSRAVLERVGLLDERFFVYFEDTDYCLRLKRAGIPIHYVPDQVMLHDSSALSGGHNSRRFIRLFYRSYIQLLMKYFGLAYTLRAMLRLGLKNIRHRDSSGAPAGWSIWAAMLHGLASSVVRR